MISVVAVVALTSCLVFLRPNLDDCLVSDVYRIIGAGMFLPTWTFERVPNSSNRVSIHNSLGSNSCQITISVGLDI